MTYYEMRDNKIVEVKGDGASGSTLVSKSKDEGSSPSLPAIMPSFEEFDLWRGQQWKPENQEIYDYFASRVKPLRPSDSTVSQERYGVEWPSETEIRKAVLEYAQDCIEVNSFLDGVAWLKERMK